MKEKNLNIGIINSNPELIEILTYSMQHIGFNPVIAHIFELKKDPVKYLKFIRKYDPRVLIIDIAIPYEENWKFAKSLKSQKESEDRGFIFTSTNKSVLEGLVGEKTDCIEIVGKPFDLEEIEARVKKMYSLKGYPPPEIAA